MFKFYGFAYEEIEYIQNRILEFVETFEEGVSIDEIQDKFLTLCDNDDEFMTIILDELMLENKLAFKDDKYLYMEI